MNEWKQIIESAWNNRELLKENNTIACINAIIEEVDKGRLRTAEPSKNGWQVNDWVKKAIILYFPIQKMETLEMGALEFHDKMKLKSGYAKLGVRVVPHASTLWCFFSPWSYPDALLCKYRSLCG